MLGRLTMHTSILKSRGEQNPTSYRQRTRVQRALYTTYGMDVKGSSLAELNRLEFRPGATEPNIAPVVSKRLFPCCLPTYQHTYNHMDTQSSTRSASSDTALRIRELKTRHGGCNPWRYLVPPPSAI